MAKEIHEANNDLEKADCLMNSLSHIIKEDKHAELESSWKSSTFKGKRIGFCEVRPLLRKDKEEFPLFSSSCRCCGIHGKEAHGGRYKDKSQPSSNGFGGWWGKSLEKAKYLASNITVEPIMFLNVMAYTLQTTLVTNMVLEKVCQTTSNQTFESCQNLTYIDPDVSAGVQKTTTKVMMAQELVANIPSVLYALVLGTWSDKYGRKLPLLLPILGNFMASLLYMINASLWWLPPDVVILAAVPRGLTGGFITLLMSSYSYITDVSTHESRTLRMAFLDFVMFIATPTGLYVSTTIFNSYGYMGVFTVSCSCFLLATVYLIVHLKETRCPSYDPTEEHLCPRSRRKKMLGDIFDLSKIKASLYIATRRRENYTRARIFSLMAALCLLLFILGSLQLKYLFTKAKFNWTYDQFVDLSIYDIVFGSFGTSLVLPILSYKLKMEDTALGLLGCISKVIGLVLMAISPVSWFLYLASTLSCLAGLPLVVTRAFISKLVPPQEIGAVFSLLASWEALVPLLSTPLYTYVYAATVDYFPGAIYFVSSLAATASAFIYLFNCLIGSGKEIYANL